MESTKGSLKARIVGDIDVTVTKMSSFCVGMNVLMQQQDCYLSSEMFSEEIPESFAILQVLLKNF